VRVQVLIRPKEGILDPQGQTVEQALQALGFEGARNVHVGRLIELDVDNPGRVPEMCERLLANPLIEDFEITSAEHPAPRADDDVRPPAGRDDQHSQPAGNAA
jgi:phosphoribosylformylglycinamidine synthase subunit PurS